MMKGMRKLLKRYYVNQILALLLVSFMLVNPVLAVVPPASDALPTGGSVPGLPGEYGSVGSFDYSTAGELHVRDVAERTVIYFDTHDIGADALAQYHQLGINPWVLVKVTGSVEPSGIYGDLIANGGFILVNTNGIAFGPGSSVTARDFIASGIDIDNDEFMLHYGDGLQFATGIESPYGDVTNEGNIQANGLAALIGRNVTNKGTIAVDPGGYVVMAAGENVLLAPDGSNVFVSMSNPATHVVDNGGDDGSGPGTGPGEITSGNVILAAGDIFSTAIMGVESLRAEAKRDITLNGAIEAGSIELTAAHEGVIGTVRAESTLESTTGDIEISAAPILAPSIILKADVTAAQDLLLNNYTSAADGITLLAGRDVDIHPISGFLDAEGDLIIEATTGEIKENPRIYMKENLKTLTLTQQKSLDMDDFSVSNSDNTYLVANSTGSGDNEGDVISTEADQWMSIAAHAYKDIALSGDSHIRTGALTSDTKDIVVTSDLGKVIASENIEATLGGVYLTGDEGIEVSKDITAGGAGDIGGIILDGAVTAVGTTNQIFDAGTGTLWAKDTITKPTGAWGNLTLAADTLVDLDGLHAVSGDSVRVGLFGALTIDGPVDAEGHLKANGHIHITGPANLAGDVIATGSDITFDEAVEADGEGNQEFDAGSGTLWAKSTLTKTTTGDLTLGGATAIDLDGTVDVDDGSLVIEDAFNAAGDLLASADVTLDAAGILDGATQRIDAEGGKLTAEDGVDITKITSGSLTLAGETGIYLGGDVSTNAADGVFSMNHLIFEDAVIANGTGDHKNQTFTAHPFSGEQAGSSLLAQSTITKIDGGDPDIDHDGGNLTLQGAWQVNVDGDVAVEDGTLTIEADQDIYLGSSAISKGDMILTADADGDAIDWVGTQWADLAGGDVTVEGDLDSTDGSITISGFDETIYLGGDVTAAVDVTLNNDTVFTSDDDQKVDAQTGMITAKGWLWKNSDWGSLYLEAAEDISLSDHVEVDWGGASIISENGKIFTPDEFGGETDTLNVYIEGYSDDKVGDGVDLPHGEGKAAIVIISKEDLKIGSDAQLHASGTYYDDVDDRAGMNLLDEPATIGGVPRDEGDLFDVAIYVASTEGDVDVSSPVTITSGSFPVAKQGNGFEYEAKGAMVIDAWDTVTFDGGVPGGLFETSLADGEVGDRLEVVSRISEWLFQAVGKLPYVYGGGPFVPGYEYILRGAGQGNPDILGVDDRAWVLEDPPEPAPLYREAGQNSEEQEFAEGGCPALMTWFADEVGVPEDQIQVVVQDAFASATDIQPCEACARLRDAATILDDEEGTYMAALGAVVNEFTTPDAPIAPEQMTLIASAVASADPGTIYATAGEWLDSLVQYVAVMNTEMGYSAAEAVAFAGKYTAPITEGGDAGLASYVGARLEAVGG